MTVKKQAPRRGLKKKVILSILVVGAVPLAVGMVMAYFQGTRELRQLSGTTFAGIASETARKLDSVFRDELVRTAGVASDPRIIGALDGRRGRVQGRAGGQTDETRRDRWEAMDAGLIREVTGGELAGLLGRYLSNRQAGPGQAAEENATIDLFLTDAGGNLVAATGKDISYNSADEVWWRQAYHGGTGQAYFGNLYYDEGRGVHAFSLSVPVMDRTGRRALGVLHRVFDAKEYLDPALSPIRFGKTGHVMLINGEGIVISCPILPTGTQLTDPELIRLVTGAGAGWVKSPSDGHGGRTQSIVGFSPLSVNAGLTEKSPGDAWNTFVWQSSAELFAPMQSLFRWIIVSALTGLAFLGLLGYATATRIVRPIRQLQHSAVLIGQGKLQEPIRVRTGDEIEQLAEAFNRMHAQLQNAFSGLRNEVQEQRQEVRYLQQYNEQILQSIPLPILIVDPEEGVEYVNRAASEILGLGVREPQGAKLFDLLLVARRAREGIRQEIQNCLEIWAMSGQASGPAAGRPADAMSLQTALRGEYSRREVKINGTSYQYQCFRIPARSGDQVRIGLVLRDTTQDSRVQDQMIQTERLASLDILSSGIGHELNNPLHGIIGLCEAILDEQQAPQIKEYAKRILEHARRMAGIIQDFSGYSRVDEGDLYVQMDLNQCLDKALQIVGALNGKGGPELRRSYKPLPKMRIVPEEIIQMFANIFKNAVQAMGGKGVLQVTTDIAYGAITIRIADSGPGIPKKYVSRIFDPFFTTKGADQGKGLGLTVVRRIMAKYNAQIRVESEESGGTTFILIFPI